MSLNFEIGDIVIRKSNSTPSNKEYESYTGDIIKFNEIEDRALIKLHSLFDYKNINIEQWHPISNIRYDVKYFREKQLNKLGI